MPSCSVALKNVSMLSRAKKEPAFALECTLCFWAGKIADKAFARIYKKQGTNSEEYGNNVSSDG